MTSDAALILVSSLAAAGCAALFLLRRGRGDRSLPAMAEAPEGRAVFLFRDGLLIDANREAMRILGSERGRVTAWEEVASRLAPRFPALADHGGDSGAGADRQEFPALAKEDEGKLVLEHPAPGMTRLTLHSAEGPAFPEHEARLAGLRLSHLDAAATAAPLPVWIVDTDGTLLWSNPAHDSVRQLLGRNAERGTALFDPAEIDAGGGEDPARLRIARPDGQEHWFDVTMRRHEGFTVLAAKDVSAQVIAETAQRNFVQTLAKTFAHLATGLAIFDRQRRLVLFNPALADLTRLPPEFLTRRPTLRAFFDELRARQMMPEPRNYAGWRETLADVVMAARDGRYTETWNLPAGLTYRVTGRPHPDGAIAFLFEDISAEISLTRQFRRELELCHAALDALSGAFAVFSPTGTLVFASAGYAELWGGAEAESLREITLAHAVDGWRASAEPADIWADLHEIAQSPSSRRDWQGEIRTTCGKRLHCRLAPISAGAILVRFDQIASDEAPAGCDRSTTGLEVL